ncbi:helicase C-terminal domain-containing protein, partial [Mycobacterium celatum]|uniref:helicase C-terminal domain-containing protein n=1 Tax=Mycobacterium celatum TaxID=28045 RepID=UPI000AA988D6
ADAMADRLSTPVPCQGDDSTGALVEQFAADDATSLFGTLSLWQGVDVPGPSLSLVIIDRIPFPRPDDPLLSARQRAVTAHGGNGFMAVAASHAALLLAQGRSGRPPTAPRSARRWRGYGPHWRTARLLRRRAFSQRDQTQLGVAGEHRVARQHPH